MTMAQSNGSGGHDVLLKVDEKLFPCRRDLLSKHSPYFEAMFNHNFIEKDKRIIEIQNVEVESMATLLRFIQSGDISEEILKSEQIHSLLQASMMLQFESVQKICINVITQEWLTIETCLQTMATADVLDIISLRRKAKALALLEFSRVKSTNAFLDLPIETLEEYLGSDHLNAANEFEVFDAGVSWLQEDTEGRSQYMQRILQCVRFSEVICPDIRTMFLYPNITEGSKVQNIMRCLLLLKEDLIPAVLDTARDRSSSESSSSEIIVDEDDVEKTELNATVCKRRKSEHSKELEIISNGSQTQDSECIPRSCSCFCEPIGNLDCLSWSYSDLTALPSQCTRSNGQSSSNSLLSRLESKHVFEKLKYFDSEIFTFATQLLKKPPRKLPLVPCVIGHQLDKSSEKPKGRTNFNSKPYVIYFDEEKTSQPIAFLHLAKVSDGPVEPTGYRVVNKGRDLYVVGGEYLLGYGNWNKTIWKYDILKEEWTYETSLLSPRRHHSVCIVGDDIYVIGGFGRHRVIMDAVEKYNIPSRGLTSILQPLDLSVNKPFKDHLRRKYSDWMAARNQDHTPSGNLKHSLQLICQQVPGTNALVFPAVCTLQHVVFTKETSSCLELQCITMMSG